MDVLTKQEFLSSIDRVAKGEVFVYPTDTIYGLGCNATNESSVSRLRSIKQRPKLLLSVIAPGKDWIKDHCVMTDALLQGIAKLPGPYTLIVKLKDPSVVASNVSFGNTLGIRIPHHWISSVVAEIGVPVITTSVNLSGQPSALSLSDISPQLKDQIGFGIDEGRKSGSASVLLDCTTEQIKEQSRS